MIKTYLISYILRDINIVLWLVLDWGDRKWISLFSVEKSGPLFSLSFWAWSLVCGACLLCGSGLERQLTLVGWFYTCFSASGCDECYSTLLATLWGKSINKQMQQLSKSGYPESFYKYIWNTISRLGKRKIRTIIICLFMSYEKIQARVYQINHLC